MVKLSVITLTHGNRADVLLRCIESVLRHTPMDFDYYIIDNNASSETQEVIKKYTRLCLPEFKWIHLNKNEGTPARNYAIEKSTADYFAIIDDDVVINNSYWFEEMHQYLVKPNAWAVGECGAVYNPKGEYGFFGERVTEPGSKVHFLTGYHVLYKNLRASNGEPMYLIDRNYRSLREESDFGFQAQVDGYNLYVCPSFCFHNSIRKWDPDFDSIDADTKYFIDKWTPIIKSGHLNLDLKEEA
jgi:glycosyltransferase involved in cell wall biosynthesis